MALTPIERLYVKALDRIATALEELVEVQKNPPEPFTKIHPSSTKEIFPTISRTEKD